MRNFFSISLHGVAGLFFSTVCLLSFIKEPSIWAKFWIMIAFSIPGLFALLAGLALKQFQSWKNIVGIVLLFSSGIAAFSVFSIFCMLMNEDFREMMSSQVSILPVDYFSGLVFAAFWAILGFLFLKMDKNNAGNSSVEV